MTNIKSKEVKPSSPQDKAQEFIKEYEELCEKHGFQIAVTPAFKARDDGTFSVVLQSSISRLPKIIMTDDKVKLAVLENNFKSLSERLRNKVNLERFSPIEKIVYGFTGLILMAVAGAVIALVIKS